MNNINIHKKLVGKGYFPDELGFWFSSVDLEINVDKIKQSVPINKKLKSMPIKYSIPKGRYTRRNLSIPNPYNYFYLSKEIADHWDIIDEHYANSDISLTKPIFRQGTTRAISRKFSFEQITEKFIINSVGSNYVLKTDISRYYSTIYTHSIPWALHTKEVSKTNKEDSLLGNLLDKLIRNAQDQQTIGIPIGPDCSLIIAEIIGVALDKIIMNKINCLSCMRYVDDYYIFFKSRYDAERALSIIQKVLNEYELELNREKTQIYEMPRSIEPNWVSKINNIHLNNENLISFISTVYSLMVDNPDQDVLRYSLAKLNKLKINKKNWNLAQSFILNSALYDGSAMPLACSILSNYYHKRYGIDKDKVIKIFENIIEKSLVSNCDYEIIWMLWLTHLLNITITDEIIKKLCNNENPMIALILLNLYRNNRSLDTSNWQKYMTPENLYSDHWILAYEALVRGWLPSINGEDYVENDIFFKALKKYHVRFFIGNARDIWINDNIEEKWLPIFSPAF